ncbi:Prenyltransferase and squalene oxidase repeat protein [Pseudobythopirellula maris]|uniref:Prenyltransferase and squalene oxidase repeat protein n=1 Tax=Pseudobythopirellula maris TaxID=2527991 RepID=A0A5C5ZS27_9BACT|nr:prenyltransferase/squalene oxidase repeat-containing protein [Pseudobythopirellula maris]TWT90100.1 Prenyltransferase and squalene oxidase repeat protein [Pseudobythopirellula maris]
MTFSPATRTRRFALALFACTLAASTMVAPAMATPDGLGDCVDRAIGFLRSSQAEDGSFSSHAGPAITALVATGLMENGRSPSDPMVSKAVDYVVRFANEDGSISSPQSTHRNYETCVAVQCLKATGDTKHKPLLDAAEKFLKGLQWDEEEGHGPTSTSYGGAGYGNHRRPDLSNTSFLIEALHELGTEADDPAMQKALAFVSRAQNLETEHNTTPFADKVNDGGFYYTPAAGGSSQAGETASGGLRSYGSMTYAGLKSMIFAGLDQDDPRVAAALKWIGASYTLAENPGMGTSGLYYYYHTFAKALDAAGESVVVDADGEEHDWRQDLVTKLAELQKEDGSWINANERWLEADPNLSTSYCLLALAHCRGE